MTEMPFGALPTLEGWPPFFFFFSFPLFLLFLFSFYVFVFLYARRNYSVEWSYHAGGVNVIYPFN